MYRRSLALVVVLALAIAACGGDSGGDDGSTDEQSPAGDASPDAGDSGDGGDGDSGLTSSDDPVTLFLPSGAFERSMLPVLDRFVEETGIEVNPIAMPAADARSRQVLDLDANQGEVDLILLDDTSWLAEVSRHLEPLGPHMEDDGVDVDDFIPALVDIFNMDGNQYAFPLGMSARTIIYRTDIFEEAGLEGPPWTFDEFMENAATLTTDDMFGFSGPWGRESTYVAGWMVIAKNFGLEDVLENNETAAFNNEAGRAAAQLMADLYIEGYMPPDAIEFAHDGVLTSMQEGRAAMTLLPTTFFGPLNDPEVTEHAGNFAIAPMPTGPGVDEDRYVVTGWGYGLSKYSQNQENAWELVKFLNEAFQRPGEDADREQLLRPGSESSFNHPGVKEIFPNGQDQVVREILSKAEQRPALSEWSEIEAVIASALQGAFLEQHTVEEGFAEAEEQVNAILSR